ncbi:MAG: HD domain-containing protein [Bacilli bacterium]|nr:HD domain-containing protein [Bacilli bacterium]
MINQDIKKYIEKNIYPEYQKNDSGHNIDHIKYVLERSLKFAKTVPDINLDMVYVIAAFHDIGHHIDAKNHEQVSSEILEKDEFIKDYFTKDELKTMVEAVVDHRASLEYIPRSIYGKIVSSADRNTDIDIPLKRTYSYRLEHFPNATLDEIIEESRQHIIDKFGSNGYAKDKIYFEDEDYNNFLKEVELFAEDKELFRKRFIEVNNIK